MAAYINLRDKVRDWSNRDSQVLSDNIIRDCIRYAADKAYRDLRIPPLELKVIYTMTADQAENRFLPVPADLTEFISLTKSGKYITKLEPLETAPEGTVCEYNDDGTFDEVNCEEVQVFQSLDDRQIVYNQKVDIRTFRDAQASHPQYPFWTREQGRILLSSFPAPSEGDVFELYYYGRGLAVDIDNVGTLEGTQTQRYLQFVSSVTIENGDQTVTEVMYIDVANRNLVYTSTDETDSDAFRGEVSPVFNWLRDENERVLLFGALMECFAYLGEDDMQAKYLQMFQEEINELNREEEMRTASGGNTVIQYTSYLI